MILLSPAVIFVPKYNYSLSRIISYNTGMDYLHVLYAGLAGILPAMLWLWFWLREDSLHPEPKKTIAKAFIGGMLAMLAVLPLQFLTNKLVDDQTVKYVIWAFLEEVLKFLFVYITALRTREVDEPIDDLIYLVTGALGFAALENTFYILNEVGNGGYISSIVTANLRFIGASLVHVVASAVIGYAAARTFYKKSYVRAAAISFAIVVATVLHSIFNLNIMTGNSVDKLKVFGFVWLGVIIILLLFERIKSLELNSSVT